MLLPVTLEAQGRKRETFAARVALEWPLKEELHFDRTWEWCEQRQGGRLCIEPHVARVWGVGGKAGRNQVGWARRASGSHLKIPRPSR